MTEEINLFAELSALPRPHRIVPFPRKRADGSVAEVAMVVLTIDEQSQARKEAHRRAKEGLKIDPNDPQKAYDQLYNDWLIVCILFHAVRIPSDIKKKAASTYSDLSWLSEDEMTVLFGNYVAVKNELGPLITELNADEQEAIIQKIIKDGVTSSFLANSYSQEIQTQLMNSMASQLKALQTVNTSPGLPQENTTQTSPNTTI